MSSSNPYFVMRYGADNGHTNLILWHIYTDIVFKYVQYDKLEMHEFSKDLVATSKQQPPDR